MGDFPAGDGAAQGGRVKVIRDELRLTQTAFATQMNFTAGRLGFPATYDAPKVARMETDKRGVSLEDALVLAELDPLQRGVHWLARGVEYYKEARRAEPVDPGDVQPMPRKRGKRGA